MPKNKHGLSRYIPVDVRREVRQNSKFGCVICRGGISQYEHIENFKDVKEHDPDKICCLCGSCHDKVNRGIFSKEYVKKRYKEVRYNDEIEPPKDVFDLHTDQAELLVAGNENTFAPGITFSVYGNNILQANTGESKTGEIYADFTDENGVTLFRIVGDQWVAFDRAWDVKVEGTTYSVHASENLKVLELEADPPSKIKVNHLDMRIGPVHLMATRNHFVVGRYVDSNACFWLTASLDAQAPARSSAFIEVTPPQGDNFSIDPTSGVSVEPVGISIAPSSSRLLVRSVVHNVRSVPHVRKYFFEAARGGDKLDLIEGDHFLLREDLNAYSLTTGTGE